MSEQGTAQEGAEVKTEVRPEVPVSRRERRRPAALDEVIQFNVEKVMLVTCQNCDEEFKLDVDTPDWDEFVDHVYECVADEIKAHIKHLVEEAE